MQQGLGPRTDCCKKGLVPTSTKTKVSNRCVLIGGSLALTVPLAFVMLVVV
eukprot:CAMPEP_0203934312 /NCGR_PEP_ID=MMETSP0359-20131031/72295_1 /ASSEMBLY_ACC=CAM_ASM_000338 /TAXON_ID=268821 /ORGANISM="Scrippsiella Hangoei, Strain SHTV-5" /LENGTH=50 /DNA_ID=CAMNT_0050864007 /DNA_START=100 /DNA_END=248 /DNA_ORIENTATION=-